MRTQLIDLMAAGLVDATGTRLASGTVYVYEAGTTTPAVLYESGEDPDEEDVDAVANPVTLDAAGRKRVWVEGQVKLVIHDSAGTLVETLDYIGPNPSDSFVAPPSIEVSDTCTSFATSTTGWEDVTNLTKTIVFEEDCTVFVFLEGEAEAAELALTGTAGVADAKGLLQLLMDNVSEGAREMEQDDGSNTSTNAKRAGIPVSAIGWRIPVTAGEHTFKLQAKAPDANRTVSVANLWLQFVIFGQQ